MSITVRVGLLSGKTAALKASLDEEVETLKRQAQAALGIGRGRLLDTCGRPLDPSVLIKNAGLQNGDSLTLAACHAEVCDTGGAFAAMLGDASVVTWGSASHGGDSRAVQDQLKHVQQIHGTGAAFAAILGDGSVVTWGPVISGGDSSAVQHQLKNVRQITATGYSHALLPFLTMALSCHGEILTVAVTVA